MISTSSNFEHALPFRTRIGALPFAVGFYFAFRIVSVLLAVRVLGADPQVGTAINITLDFVFLLAVAFCSGGPVLNPLHWMAGIPSVRWVVLYLGFSCCSLMWSSTASLPSSAAYWCAMCADVTILLLLLQRRSPLEVADSLMKGFVWGACLVAAIAWILPTESDLRLGDEDLLGPNQFGYVCAFAFFFAQYLLRNGRGKLGVQALFLAVTLLRSLSKTTIVAFLVSQGFLLISDKSISRKTKILLAASAVAVLGLFWGLLTSYFDVYSNAGNQSETLTGRLGIWTYFLAEGIQQPWVGHGFDSAWKVIPPFAPDQFEAAHAHNELLQQFYAYGVIGIVMFAGIYSSLFRHIRQLAKGPQRSFFLAFLLFILVRGLADTDRFDLSLPMWAILMVSVLVENEAAARAGVGRVFSADFRDNPSFSPGTVQ